VSDFVLHDRAKQNGQSVLVGSTGAGVFPGFASAADQVLRFLWFDIGFSTTETCPR
jgi:hypothetical protein